MFTREKFLDTGELAVYGEKVRKRFEAHTVKVLAAYGKYEVLEGADTEGVMIAEFPSLAAAKAWYDRLAYRKNT